VFSGRNVTLAVDRERLRFELDIANDEAASRRLRLNPGGALELPSSLALECDRETIRFSPIGLADPFEIALSNETGRVTLRSGDYSGKPVLEEGPAS
jgi:hypothetical protein